MSEYTKGPWTLCFHLKSHENDKSCNCGFRGHIWGADGEHVVCEMGSTEIEGQEGMNPPRYPRSVELANARLISAAPDLLRACKQALEVFEAMGHDDLVCAIDLRAAIAKAVQL